MRIGGFTLRRPMCPEPVVPIAGYMGFVPGLQSKNYFGGTWQAIISEIKPPSPTTSPAASPPFRRTPPQRTLHPIADGAVPSTDALRPAGVTSSTSPGGRTTPPTRRVRLLPLRA